MYYHQPLVFPLLSLTMRLAYKAFSDGRYSSCLASEFGWVDVVFFLLTIQIHFVKYRLLVLPIEIPSKSCPDVKIGLVSDIYSFES